MDTIKQSTTLGAIMYRSIAVAAILGAEAGGSENEDRRSGCSR